MKVLVISKYFYPTQNPRSFRTTELVKEFSRRGIEVTVAIPNITDETLIFCKKHNIIVKRCGKEYHKISNSNLFIMRVLNKILYKLFEFPDITFAWSTFLFLIRTKVKYNLLLTIAFPHSIHWGAAIAKRLRKKNIFWIADCGDPFMGNSIFNPVFYFKYLEILFCKQANYITIPIKEGKTGYYSQFWSKVNVIPQGFNFDDVKRCKFEGNEIPTCIFAGTFYKGHRDPSSFFQYLLDVKHRYKFIIYTDSIALLDPWINKLAGNIELRSFIPRLDLIKELSKADFLINFENVSSIQSPSKLIDYSLADRPILSINNNINDHSRFIDFIEGKYESALKIPIEPYNIKTVATQFLNLYYGKSS